MPSDKSTDVLMVDNEIIMMVTEKKNPYISEYCKSIFKKI